MSVYLNECNKCIVSLAEVICCEIEAWFIDILSKLDTFYKAVMNSKKD